MRRYKNVTSFLIWWLWEEICKNKIMFSKFTWWNLECMKERNENNAYNEIKRNQIFLLDHYHMGVDNIKRFKAKILLFGIFLFTHIILTNSPLNIVHKLGLPLIYYSMLIRCAHTPQWMEFSIASLILNNSSRNLAISARTSVRGRAYFGQTLCYSHNNSHPTLH